ncbi:MAG: DUF5320 domain-containing protein [bacterium]
MHRKPEYIKYFLIILFILFDFMSGCGRPFVRPEKYEAQKTEKKKKKLLKRQREVTAELKIIDDKLNDAAGQILIFTAKQNKNRVMSIEERKLNNEYIKKVSAAENETKTLKKQYDTLAGELKEIEQKLKELGHKISP